MFRLECLVQPSEDPLQATVCVGTAFGHQHFTVWREHLLVEEENSRLETAWDKPSGAPWLPTSPGLLLCLLIRKDERGSMVEFTTTTDGNIQKLVPSHIVSTYLQLTRTA